MRFGGRTLILFFLLPILLGSCGNKKSDDSTSSSAAYVVKAVNQLHLAQSFTANTPKGFKNSTALQLTDACTSEFGNNDPQTTACNTMADIQSRFFSGTGPTDIKTRLAGLDGSLNSMLSNWSSSYVPCLDSSRTTSGTYAISQMGVQSNTPFTFPPYALTSVALKSTFLNSFALDTGDTVKLSCFDANGGDAKTGVGNGYGFDEASGTWYLYSLGAQHIGMYGSADQNDNIQMWFNIGDTSFATDQGQDATEKTKGSSIYGGSTGIVQILSKPSQGLIGLSQVGVGIGPGCGAQLLMNSATLYFEGNVNNYGVCTDTDFAVTSTNLHNADLDKVAVCMNVSGSTVTPTSDLSACVNSGLISLDDNGDVVSPFAAAGLKYLTADQNSTVAKAIKVRAWMGSFFMANTDLSALPPLGGVKLATADQLQVTGFSKNSFQMNRTTAASNQTTSVSALCSATGLALQSTMTESFQISIADIAAAQKAVDSSATAASVVSSINTAVQNTGDASAVILVPITGTKGTSFTGTFAGTATAKLDTTSIGTATLALPAKDGVLSQLASIAIPSTTQVTESSVFTVTLSGKLTMSCSNKNDILRTVSAKAGLASLVWFVKQDKK